MIKRQIEDYLIYLSKCYPIVTVVGPRQSGKTTLAKKCFSQYNYVNLESPNIRQMAEDDPIRFLKSYNL